MFSPNDTTTIQGNLIGTNAKGTAAIPNGEGILFTTAGLIGGTVKGAGNVISGNDGDGIDIDLATGPVTVQGNLIGTDAKGKAKLANSLAGIYVHLSDGVTIGVGSGRNVISGNDEQGIFLDDSSDTIIGANYIGVDSGGSKAVPNGSNGVGASGTSEHTHHQRQRHLRQRQQRRRAVRSRRRQRRQEPDRPRRRRARRLSGTTATASTSTAATASSTRTRSPSTTATASQSTPATGSRSRRT